MNTLEHMYVIDVTELNFEVKSDLGGHNGLRVDTRVIKVADIKSDVSFDL